MSEYTGWSPLRRVGFATKFGVIPVGITGAIADIGAPFDLWILPICAAVVALFAWLLLFYLPRLRSKLGKLLAQSDGTSGACTEPFIPSAASAALLLACLTGLGVGWLSFSQRGDGGFLGSNLDIVNEIQKVSGLLEGQGKTLGVIEDNTGKATTILDTGEAAEPRVTLGNLGIQWSRDSFREAVKLGDVRVMDLFLRGGMPAKNAFAFTSDFTGFLKDPHPGAMARLRQESFELPPTICGPQSWESGHQKQDTLARADSREFYASVCNNTQTFSRLAEDLATYRTFEAETARRNASLDADKKACLRLLNSREGVDAALALGFPPKYDDNLTIDHPIELMAARLLPVMMRPGSTDDDIQAIVPESARESCDAAFTARESNEYHASLIRDYEAVLELMR